MKKSFLVITVLVSLCLISTRMYSNLTGAINATGAPGEGDCTGCHLGALNPNPDGAVKITIQDTPKYYTPGQTYVIQVTSSYSGRSRFGFALSARSKGIGFTSCGLFSKGTNSNIQVFDYVTHTSSGTSASNTKTWSFNWKAPSTDQGAVTFYTASVAANGDNSNAGDFVYSSKLVFKSAAQAGISEETQLSSITCYPNPVIQNLNITFFAKEESALSAVLYALNGTECESLFNGNISAGSNQLNLEVQHQYPHGIYFLKLETRHGIAVQKLFL